MGHLLTLIWDICSPWYRTFTHPTFAHLDMEHLPIWHLLTWIWDICSLDVCSLWYRTFNHPKFVHCDMEHSIVQNLFTLLLLLLTLEYDLHYLDDYRSSDVNPHLLLELLPQNRAQVISFSLWARPVRLRDLHLLQKIVDRPIQANNRAHRALAPS